MSKNWNTHNIDTVIVRAEPLISSAVAYHGGQCECVAFLRTSSQKAIEDVLENTHQKKNKDTPDTDEILKKAREKQKEQYVSLAKSDDDVRMTRHKLPHTRNRVNSQQPVRVPINYIRKAFWETDLPPAIVSATSERKFVQLSEALPIRPQKISDQTLQNLWLAPDNFDTYCNKAKEIYGEVVWKKIAHILLAWRPVLRSKEQGRSSRIMQIHSLDWETRYALFINQDTLYYHQTPSRTTPHKVVSTSCRIFGNYDDLLRSQEYALQHLTERLEEYAEWQNILQNTYSWDTEDAVSLLEEAKEYFWKQKWFYVEKIVHYLKRETKDPRKYISHALRNLYNAIQDIQKKKVEIEQVYKNLAKWREEMIMQEVRKTAQLINK